MPDVHETGGKRVVIRRQNFCSGGRFPFRGRGAPRSRSPKITRSTCVSQPADPNQTRWITQAYGSPVSQSWDRQACCHGLVVGSPYSPKSAVIKLRQPNGKNSGAPYRLFTTRRNEASCRARSYEYCGWLYAQVMRPCLCRFGNSFRDLGA
jgi:hypothetical protein